MNAQERRELVERLLTDFEFYCETALLVEDKQTQQLVPLKLKPVQRKLARTILERWLRGAPARIIILKARREGVSTLVQAFMFWVCSTRQNRKAFTIAHDDDTSAYLFGMSEGYYENLPAFIRPMRKASRRGSVLEFANPSKKLGEAKRKPGLRSSLSTVTHKNAGAGKGATLLHGSEVAFWPTNSAKKTLDMILQTIPRAGQTLVVLESTANGVGNEFHQRWTLAEQGQSGYIPFFIPWIEEPTYTETPPPDFQRTEEEDDVADLARKRYGVEITDGQLQWRRLTLEDECGGSLDTFHEQYPLIPEEAFLATGRPYFNQRVLARHLEKARQAKPWKRGYLRERVVQGELWTVFEESQRGFVTIWNAPQPDEDYLIFADASEGKERSDFLAAYVMPRSRMEVDAVWHGRIDRDSFGDELYMLGKLYGGVSGEALIAVEVTGGWGRTPVAILERTTERLGVKRPGYGRLYKTTTVDRRTNKRHVSLGWKTTPESRALMLDSLNQALRTDALEANDPELIKECLTFIYGDDGKPQAQQGCFDDRVMAASGACYLWTAEPRKRKPVETVVAAPRSAVTGY